MKTKAVVLFSGGLDSTVLLCYEKILSQYEKTLSQEVIPFSISYGSKHNEREREAAQRIRNDLNVPLVTYNLPVNVSHYRHSTLGFHVPLLRSDLQLSGGEIPEGHYTEDSMKLTVVPFRNAIMISLAVGFAQGIGASRVLIASHMGDHTIYPDCREEFISAMGVTVRRGTDSKVNLEAPFGKWSKTDIVKMGAEIKAPMHLSWSCYKGGEKHCGKCGTCVERREAFEQANVEDPTDYE